MAGAAIADDVSNGPRLARQALSERKDDLECRRRRRVIRTSERTLVVLAHHDAAQTGLIFDDRAQAWLGEMFPGVIERIDTSLPLFWALLSGPRAGRPGRRSGAGAA